jgi:hypothetical protein
VVVILHQAEGGADVVILQYSTVVVEQGNIRTGEWLEGNECMLVSCLSCIPCVYVEVVGSSRVLEVVYHGGHERSQDLQFG